MKRSVPVPPPLPPLRDVQAPGPETLVTLRVTLRVVTPILGGAARTRQIDDVDIIRAPSIRGHLRFWWRALASEDDPQALASREAEVWGRAAGEQGGRSKVRVSVRLDPKDAGQEDRSDIQLFSTRDRKATTGAYALWPARKDSQGNEAAPRRKPGTVFDLLVSCPQGLEGEIRRAVQAWILFGGYGSRTRRGVGSLTVPDGKQASEWLPDSAGLKAFLRERFGMEGSATPRDMARLRGASLLVAAEPSKDAEAAWSAALLWLSDFRQKQGDECARAKGNERPGRSRWPEPDKVRRIRTQAGGQKTWAHEPVLNGTPVWPRAAFGLPIVGQFQQKKDRDTWYPVPDPDGFELVWTDGRDVYERLASPLILKALPLADGRFLAAALWLNRAYPKGGKVGLKDPASRKGHLSVVRGSEAGFDVLGAPGDPVAYPPLRKGEGQPEGRRLRTAFLAWLRDEKGGREVLP